jgi:thymidylate synthase (FAD)
LRVELIDYLGSDLTIVNAARVSMDKESEWDWYDEKGNFRENGVLSEKDQKLIKYLARENHFTPFTHAVITVRETVPIFVARQRFKHQIGFTYNEVSRRYVDDTPEFYTPDVWRSRPEGSVKQGSGEEEIKPDMMKDILYVDRTYEGDFGRTEGTWFGYEDIIELCKDWYKNAIENGVAPEQARMVLPQSMMTSYYCTGSLSAFARAYKLRIDPHAQKEIRDLAEQWDQIIRRLYPHSWSALVD